MRQEITHGALFSGSGGFELGAQMCGIKTLWNSEIEPFPMRITRAHFPDTEHLGDIGMINGAQLAPVDIISGGSPCQDMSIAGKREGLSGARSVLFMDYIRIVKEMRKKYGKPRYMVWENVPGAFSSNSGEDFRCVLAEIVRVKDESADVPLPPKGKWHYGGVLMGDSYSIAWRVLDAQYWGVPQRRRRIFLVADFDGGSAGKILFEREGLSWNFAQSQREKQGVAATAGCGADGSGESPRFPVVLRMRCGCEGGGKGPLLAENKALTLTCNNDMVVFDAAIPIENHPQDGRCGIREDGKCQTLTGNMGTGGNNVPLVLNCYGIGSKDSNGFKSDNPHAGIYEATTSRTLDCRGGDPACNQGGIIVIEGNGSRPSHLGDGFKESEIMYTLNATEVHAVAYGIDRAAFNQGQNAQFGFSVDEERQPTMVAKGPGAVLQVEQEDGEDIVLNAVARRLTPTECARLQGFPDDWADIVPEAEPDSKELAFWMKAWAEWWAVIGRGKGVKMPKDEKAVRKWLNSTPSDSDLYKMWGNGIALPCVAYVFEGIALQINSEDSSGVTI